MEKLKASIENFRGESWIYKYRIVTDGLYRKFYALLLTGGAGSFLWKAAFNKDEPSEIMLMIVGFVIGTILTTLIAFYYGTSESDQNKENKKGV